MPQGIYERQKYNRGILKLKPRNYWIGNLIEQGILTHKQIAAVFECSEAFVSKVAADRRKVASMMDK
jgi:hypothetical protein